MEEELVRAFLEGELGSGAKYKRLVASLVENAGPDYFNPFFLFLDRFRQDVKRNFDVYWVDGGKPELFSVAQVEPALVVFSSRYVELVFIFRQILGTVAFDDYRTQAIARTALRVMAELAVYDGNLEFAEQAFIRSLIGEEKHVSDWSGLWIHEAFNQPMDEGYVANWFFGLAHDLGHINAIAHPEYQQLMFSENNARIALDYALTDYGIPQEMESAIRKSAENPSSPLFPERLNVEAYADLFAIQILIRATPFLMEKVGMTANMYAVLNEVEQCMATLYILERCKASTQWVARNSDFRGDVELYIPPLVFTARRILARKPLEAFIAHTMWESPSAENWLTVEMVLTRISKSCGGLLREILNGLTEANRFVFLPDEKRRFRTRAFTPRSIDLGNASVRTQIKKFCSLIESLHGDVDCTRRLRNIVGSVETE